MRELEIVKGIRWIGAIDHDLRVFDITMYTEFGTSYNSYLIEGTQKTAIVETVKHTFTDVYIDYLKKNVDLSLVDYIVVNHTEPDHVGTVAKLLDFTPKAKIVGSFAAIRFLKEITNRPFESIVVKEGDEISLGDKTLRFIMAPFLHWPDSIYTYVPEDKVLFTCDSFGAHYAFDDVFASKITDKEDYNKALKYYFDMIFGPFKSNMLSAVAKIEGLDIDYICNGHGPILDDHPMEIVKVCKEWSKEKPLMARVVIPYVSAYGYSKELAETIQKGIQSIDGYEAKLYDMVYADENQVMEEISQAEGVLFGSPTINGDALLPIMNLLIKLNPIIHGGKYAAAFGSYGWSGEAVENLSRRMSELKFKVVKGFRVNFKPTQEDLKDAFNFGADFVKIMTKEEVFVSYDAPKNITHTIADDSEKPVKKWICTICQEVFEGTEPPEVCAACGATKEQFEEYIEDKVELEKDIDEHVVIVGNGIAGVSVAETLRKHSEKVRITIIDKSDQPVYYKPMLSKFIGLEDMPKSFYIHDKQWYDKHQIEFIAPVSLEAISNEEKTIVLSNKKRINYDKLIIAAGSESFVPPIQNKDIQGVYTLRTYDDAIAIKASMRTAKKAVVIGGGLLGLEAAAQMKHGGLKVSVVEIMDRILPRQLDEKGAAILEDGFAKEGINIIKGIQVDKIVGKEKVEGVLLAKGQFIDADIILISAGVRTDLSLYQEIGMECSRGIHVNEKMETSLADIYACGDCACFSGMNYAIWPEAVLQGQTVAYSLLGIDKVYENYTPSTVLNTVGLNIFSIGNIGEEEEPSKMVYENQEKGLYKMLSFNKGKLNGGILIGDNSKSKLLIDGIKNRKSISELIEVLQ